MRIRLHIAAVLAAATVTGVGIGVVLWQRLREVESKAAETGPASVSLRAVERLRQDVDRWLLTVDLVLRRDQAALVAVAHRDAQRLLVDAKALLASRLLGGRQADLQRIGAEIEAVARLIDRSEDLRGQHRAAGLCDLAAVADAEVAVMLPGIDALAEAMQRQAAFVGADLADERRLLLLLAWVGGATWLGAVALCWLWASHRIVAPLTALGAAAEAAEHRGAPFALTPSGPTEVAQLTDSVASFVHALQTAKAHTEDQVRERTAELVAANQAKAQFLATMSHELRTPLNGIINMNELILDTRLDEEQQGFARTAKSAAEALLALINDILDFSKIEARKLSLETLDVDVRELVDSAVEILAGVAEHKGLGLHAIVHADVPAVVRGDPTRIRQVVINLLNNALKFTAKGQVTVTVTRPPGTDGLLRFAVRDTGIGIPEERRQALFSAFVQVDASTSRKYGGTGLGLAICKELAQLMGGEIGVDSVIGEGSTFWFTARLPAAAEPTVPTVPPCGRIAIVSTRPAATLRLVEQLRFLGWPATSIAVATEFGALDRSTPFRHVVVDPYGRPEAPFAALAVVATDPASAAARVFVLDHWLRHWPEAMGTPPTAVGKLVEPTRLSALREFGDAGAEGDVGDRPVPVDGSVPPSGPVPAVAMRRRRVLVADDAALNQRVAQSVLGRAGYEVVVVDDGQQAVDYVRQNPCDLLLMDQEMPVLDGVQATMAIREQERVAELAAGTPRPLPIFALTGNAQDSDRQRALAAGMNGFAVKPLRPKELLQLVAGAIGPALAGEGQA
ncbi:MAG: response regulator [Planctomycetes bacterium]|nr:response regulator [Planctomycetota bacterium]